MKLSFFASFIVAASALGSCAVSAHPTVFYALATRSDGGNVKPGHHGTTTKSGNTGDADGGDVTLEASGDSIIVNEGNISAGNGGASISGLVVANGQVISNGKVISGNTGDANGGSINITATGGSEIFNGGTIIAGSGGTSASGGAIGVYRCMAVVTDEMINSSNTTSGGPNDGKGKTTTTATGHQPTKTPGKSDGHKRTLTNL